MVSKLSPESKKSEFDISEKQSVHITKVILENFLSFQRDEIDFGNAKFVIIVGPNWSGKTSIFQAIKFSLGSNERDERYTKWSDFIRNGQNHAMVEIHIQHDEEQIKIRRFVIRGQSPFFKIQRKDQSDFKKVTVNEIQKLIIDLGINPDNQFAIVSQGKIDAIKNLKPTELCSFLEEGIGLKKLRNEIIQQKDNVLNLNNDLNSLLSRKNTLNFNYELMKPKLDRLKQKNNLLKIKKKFHDELLWANRDKLQLEINRIEENIRNLNLVINGINKKKEKQDYKIQEIDIKVSINEQEINKLSEKIGELNQQKKDLVYKIQSWEQEKILAKHEIDLLADKLKKVEAIVNNLSKQKENLEKELKVVSKENKKVGIEIDKLITEQDQLTKKIREHQLLLEKYDYLVSQKKEKIRNNEENQKLIKNLDDQINQLFQSFKDIEHKLEKNKWFLENPTTDLLNLLEKELRENSSKIYEIEAKLKQNEIERSNKVEKLKLLQTALRERRVILPSPINILREEITKRDLNVKGPIIDYLKYEDKLSYAIESVLGEKLLYSFIADNWDTFSILKRLKNKYNAYCNIYLPKRINIRPFPEISSDGVLGYLVELIKIIDNDIDVKKVLYSKIKNCLIVKDYQTGIYIYKNTNFGGKCVTLKGEQIISYKYVYETPFSKRIKGILSAGTQKEQSEILEEEIQSLNGQISDLKVELTRFDHLQKDIFSKKESFSDLLYNFNQKQRITTKKNQLYEEMHNLEEINSAIKDEIKILNLQIKELKSQNEPEFFKWNDRLKEIPNELNLLNEEKKNWDLKLEENLSILKEVDSRLNQENTVLNKLNLDYQSKKDEFQKADATAFRVFQKLERTEEEIHNKKRDIIKLKELKFEFQAEKSNLEKEIIQITLRLEQENIKLTTLRQDVFTKKEDLIRINAEIAPLVLEETINIRSVEEIEQDILNVEKELIKYLDVDGSLLVERDQILQSLKEIVKNQKHIENDIEAALKTENKLEKTYYNKFGKMIEELQVKINQKFNTSQIKAYCSLELTGDFENLGVNIKAATSKEQLKNFSALSGGQMSLISICLILSLQEIKPSPLCMFDEAGMFLDEKNSEVAYQLIKSTLEKNPIQLLMFLPNSSDALFKLAEKLIGVARVGKNEVSSIFKPKLIKKKE